MLCLRRPKTRSYCRLQTDGVHDCSVLWKCLVIGADINIPQPLGEVQDREHGGLRTSHSLPSRHRCTVGYSLAEPASISAPTDLFTITLGLPHRPIIEPYSTCTQSDGTVSFQSLQSWPKLNRISRAFTQSLQ